MSGYSYLSTTYNDAPIRLKSKAMFPTCFGTCPLASQRDSLRKARSCNAASSESSVLPSIAVTEDGLRPEVLCQDPTLHPGTYPQCPTILGHENPVRTWIIARENLTFALRSAPVSLEVARERSELTFTWQGVKKAPSKQRPRHEKRSGQQTRLSGFDRTTVHADSQSCRCSSVLSIAVSRC